MDANSVYTPASITEIIRKTFESNFPYIWIKGEINGFTRAASGHIYFTLKDAFAQIQCVWFTGRQPKGAQKFDPLTGEVFDTPQPSPVEILANGLEVLCSGSLTIYGARSQYQLNVEMARPAGAGLLALEFEARKARFAQAGYFDQARKKDLPPSPLRIAVVASPGGAAIHDFLRLANARGSGSIIRLYPAPAQGGDAAPRMADMIKLINSEGWAELIVLIRGGGSAEDLWAFNEDVLVEAIFASRLPIVAGIGHEIDVTLADLVADVRGATPSHVAQLLWPLRSELWQKLDQLQLLLEKQISQHISMRVNNWQRLQAALGWVSPIQKLGHATQVLQGYENRLGFWSRNWLPRLVERLDNLQLQLGHAQGFAKQLDMLWHQLAWLGAGLDRNIALFFDTLENNLDKKAAILTRLDPAAPLKRGYALMLGKSGMVKSVAQVHRGEDVTAWLSDGRLDLTVRAIEPASMIDGEEIFAYLKDMGNGQ